jgi:hypothetical protein
MSQPLGRGRSGARRLAVTGRLGAASGSSNRAWSPTPGRSGLAAMAAARRGRLPDALEQAVAVLAGGEGAPPGGDRARRRARHGRAHRHRGGRRAGGRRPRPQPAEGARPHFACALGERAPRRRRSKARHGARARRARTRAGSDGALGALGPRPVADTPCRRRRAVSEQRPNRGGAEACHGPVDEASRASNGAHRVSRPGPIRRRPGPRSPACRRW